MLYQVLIYLLLMDTGISLYTADATFVEYVTSATWEGVGFYISVKRDKIQEQLDAYHSSVSDGCIDGPKLVIPEIEVFHDLDIIDHHPVYVDFGHLTSHDFDYYLKDNPEPCVSVSGMEVAVTIPLLAANVTGPPVYALSLAKLYERSRGDIPKINLVYPYNPVDEITWTDSGAIVKNGTDELRVSISKHQNPCKPPRSIVKEEFEQFIISEFHVGLPKPDFSFCDRHSFQSDFCTNARSVQCAVHRYAPNICQKYTNSNPQPCEASVEIESISPGLRDFILVGNDTINILASVAYSAYSLVGLEYPCQE